MKYKINSFFERLLRACKWWIFIFKQPPWQEYETFLQIIEKRLLDMAKEFEDNPITTTSSRDAEKMRLCAELLLRYRTEYYMDKYYEEGVINKDGHPFDELLWKEGYSSKEWVSQNKDEKALKLAFKIISNEIGGWWQ